MANTVWWKLKNGGYVNPEKVDYLFPLQTSFGTPAVWEVAIGKLSWTTVPANSKIVLLELSFETKQEATDAIKDIIPD